MWRLLVGALLALVALTCAQPASAETYLRKLSWSGYTWKVRLAKRENPGKNTWGDSAKNVRVQSDGSLRLGITTGRTWKSVELAGVRNLGYGRDFVRRIIDERIRSGQQTCSGPMLLRNDGGKLTPGRFPGIRA